jgi:Holliday junction resolvase RusA-like endonuclease
MKIHFPGTFTDLNTYINAERRNRFIAAKIKKEETERVYWVCKEAVVQPVQEYPVNIHISYYMPNKRKDPDNFLFSKKFLFDGLVMAGVLRNDTWGEIRAIQEDWSVDKENPRIELEVLEDFTVGG